MKNGHVVKEVDRQRITCVCGKQAHFCEYSHGSFSSISFYYHCPDCWETPGRLGTTPAQRSGLNEVAS